VFSVKAHLCANRDGAILRLNFVLRDCLQALPFRTGEPGSGSTAAAAAADWRRNSLSTKNCEGSATSDEDHPRLVPRRGAGPDLRSAGREIDEYLMRLLHAGSVTASEAAFYQNQACPIKRLIS
jgi:hypothetical protein